MPPRRSHRGRHRRPRKTIAPAYVTAATVAAFTVSGMNVPSAIGAAARGSATPTTDRAHEGQTGLAAATALRQRIAAQNEARVSRLRTQRNEALSAALEAARRARDVAKKAEPVWVLPILHYHLTAGFGEYGLWSHAHTGQDFAAPIGTPIRAAGDGKVIFAGWDGAYGNKIVVQHPDGTVTWYAHMSAFVVTSGPVRAGQVIGKVGDTGNTTGPHLHFEVRPGGKDPIDPLPWLRAHHIKY